MPRAGDRFITHTYQKWGQYDPKRISHSRNEIPNETYLVVPADIARQFDIYMSNMAGANTEYDAYDQNKRFICTLKAQGNSKGGQIYAKNISGSGNLKALSEWINSYDITDNDRIEIVFLSSTELMLIKI
jgi:hypothetical protein